MSTKNKLLSLSLLAALLLPGAARHLEISMAMGVWIWWYLRSASQPSCGGIRP